MTIEPWRGSLLPLGCAATPDAQKGVMTSILRLLRSRAGTSSLATGISDIPWYLYPRPNRSRYTDGANPTTLRNATRKLSTER